MWHIKLMGMMSTTECKEKFNPRVKLVTFCVRSKGQISFNFNQRFLYQTLCMFSQLKDRNHIERKFHSVAWVMPQGWGLGVLGGQKLCRGDL